MVSLKSFLAVLALGVSSATAAPATGVARAESDVGRAQNTVDVYACEDTKWRGACQTFTSTAGSCYNVPKDWDNRISSIQNLNKSNFHCTWYEERDCKGSTYGNQEDANLADGNGKWNDRISAWHCS